MTDRFQMNSVVTVRGEFRTPKSAIPPSQLIDPTVVTLRLRLPDKTIEDRTYGISGIDKIDVGIYAASVTLDQEGTYYWRWQGSNGPAAVGVQSGVLDSIREPDF